MHYLGGWERDSAPARDLRQSERGRGQAPKGARGGCHVLHAHGGRRLKNWLVWRELSIKKCEEEYVRLKVHFDEYTGENLVEPQKELNLVDIENGARRMNLETYKLGKAVNPKQVPCHQRRCRHEDNRPLAEKYEVGSFPTIKFFPKGQKDSPIDYDGARTEEAFIEFLNEKCGTHRATGGLLDDKAGRLAQLDALAENFHTESAAARQTILKEVSDLAATLGARAKHHLRVMDKVVTGSEEYLEKESKRLSSILAKRTLSPAKLDEIKVKANILGAFRPPVEPVVEETTEEEVKRDEL
ncbi:hypothetical protein C8Q74DRAFT_1451600 [Fomes fomentarius]|nr:hypothetical protein C8Q74DRAFT_1451600 [Fomes fomentarius]